MQNFEDPLDLLDDEGDGVVEMSLLEEEEKRPQNRRNDKSGCCIVFLLLGSSLITAGWYVIRII